MIAMLIMRSSYLRADPLHLAPDLLSAAPWSGERVEISKEYINQEKEKEVEMKS
jgi:hypothetical protein